MKTTQQVFNGNNLELLKQYPDNYFDAIVTDPPYGLGKEPNAEQMLQAWITDGYLEVKGSGFMGKEWDAFVPQPIFWKEIFRTLKHGGHVVSFFGTRTYDWGVMAMRLAGFEVRDCIQWVYGSGFPKSYNIAKGIEGKLTIGSANTKEYKLMKGEKSTTKLGTFNKIEKEQGAKPNDCTGNETTINHILTTDEAKKWDGWGSALKPANEPIVLARKPLEKGLSIAENVMKWGTGGINIDGCRVGNELIKGQKAGQGFNNVKGFGVNTKLGNEEAKEYISLDTNGRFPANLILTHHPECECVGTKKVKGIGGGKNHIIVESKFGQVSNKPQKPFDYTDENGQETIEDWTCHEDCPIRIMDEQSGVTKSSKRASHNSRIRTSGVIYKQDKDEYRDDNTYGDKGGASRFFYCAKASKKERNKGLDSFEESVIEGRDEGQDNRNVAYKPRPTPMANIHPTVKPISLMRYLVRLITPPNGIVLDPFNGSGTTGVACKLEGINYIGMELDAEYSYIAQARIDNFTESDLEYEIEEEIVEHEVKENTLKEISKNQLNLF